MRDSRECKIARRLRWPCERHAPDNCSCLRRSRGGAGDEGFWKTAMRSCNGPSAETLAPPYKSPVRRIKPTPARTRPQAHPSNASSRTSSSLSPPHPTPRRCSSAASASAHASPHLARASLPPCRPSHRLVSRRYCCSFLSPEHACHCSASSRQNMSWRRIARARLRVPARRLRATLAC